MYKYECAFVCCSGEINAPVNELIKLQFIQKAKTKAKWQWKTPSLNSYCHSRPLLCYCLVCCSPLLFPFPFFNDAQ